MYSYNASRHSTYEQEVFDRWGDTEAYQEFEAKTKDRSHADMAIALSKLDSIFEHFSSLMKDGFEPSCSQAQALVQELQQLITTNFYTCTTDILAGLGKMYMGDERFTANIDKHGVGTAEFASRAIDIYCTR